MSINYPDGRKKLPIKQTKLRKTKTAANRGMQLESLINAANAYYIDNNIALITKRPTPINVVKIDYKKGAKIVDAYFEKQSTTDYNGIYMERYLDFEAKSTQQKTSFPLSNIYEHQLFHLQKVIEQGGIAFFIIEFVAQAEIYVYSAEKLLNFIKTNKRKSIPYETIKQEGIVVPLGINPILNYLPAVKTLFNL
ncbi:MAG TPA: Holliday junction resolvase RecU [Bacilli bacterium]|nr:Holliday junction resolvase RecU [Bacilli bacterium]